MSSEREYFRVVSTTYQMFELYPTMPTDRLVSQMNPKNTEFPHLIQINYFFFCKHSFKQETLGNLTQTWTQKRVRSQLNKMLKLAPCLSSSLRKSLSLGVLYLVQGFPYGFQDKLIPLVLIEKGHSPSAVSSIRLLLLPWLAKALFAPLIDTVNVVLPKCLQSSADKPCSGLIFQRSMGVSVTLKA